MRLADGERFVFVPPGPSRLWSISVRREDGSYREPTLGELDHFRDTYEAAHVYADSEHVVNSNHAAGDCDECSARLALRHLESVVGRPRCVEW